MKTGLGFAVGLHVRAGVQIDILETCKVLRQDLGRAAAQVGYRKRPVVPVGPVDLRHGCHGALGRHKGCRKHRNDG